jgi:DNA-binding transcriptional MerR regulator
MTGSQASVAGEHQLDKAPGAFRTISEVSEELGVPQHVLRFWESRFGQVRPLKRAGGRRYYRPEDIELLRRIQSLLYQEGYTIRGVQKLFREGGVKPGREHGAAERARAPIAPAPGLARPSQRVGPSATTRTTASTPPNLAPSQPAVGRQVEASAARPHVDATAQAKLKAVLGELEELVALLRRQMGN